MTTINDAKYFAIGAHSAIGHKRKFTNEPYHVHLDEVAHIVEHFLGAEEIVAQQIAWLHDVLEDTLVQPQDLRDIFGAAITNGVVLLSNPKTESRQQRKQQEINRLITAPYIIKTIKLADILSNAPSIITHDPAFAPQYVQEKIRLMSVLVGGHTDLYNKVMDILTDFQPETAK